MTFAYLFAALNDDPDAVPDRQHAEPRLAARRSEVFSHDEAAWIARIRAGDAEAFDALVDEYWDVMVRVGITLVGERAVAEDLAQDVLTRLWQRRGEWYTTAAGIQAHLLAAVRRRAIDGVRHARTRQRHAASVRTSAEGYATPPTPDELLARQQDVDAVVRAIAALPERRRLLVQLRFYEGMTYPAIAEVLGISTKSAEQLAGRVLQTLREALKGRV